MNVVLLGAPLLPLAAALIAALTGRRHARSAEAAALAGSAACAVGLVAAAVLLADAVRSGTTTVVVAGTPDAPVLAWSADRLGGVLLLLVFGVSAVVQLFARRYLAGDTRAWWFSACAGLLTAASAGLVQAATLLSFALCWTMAGLALCLLLATYPSLPGARAGITRTAASFAIGDAALWAAVAIATATWHTVDLQRLGALDLAGHRTASVAVALLLVVAALARSAQVPFHRWLPTTLTAPTPVSALLHAGVVNAGGVLLTRLGPVVGASGVAMHLAFVAGVLTAGYATLAMLARPDIKGSLAQSTAGQMGFMIMTCGLGLYAAAITHLVLHGCYKAMLFLSSGSAISRARRHAAVPCAPGASRVGQAAGVGVPAVALVATAAAVGVPLTAPATGALLMFAWATAAAAALGWLRCRPSGAGAVLGVGGVSAAAAGYVVAVHGASTLLAPSLTSGAAPADATVLAAAAALAFVVGGRVLRSPNAPSRLRAAVYARALGSSTSGVRAAPGRARSHRGRLPLHPRAERSALVTENRDVAERERIRLRSDVALAARVLPVHYPLRTFIAVNPLAGFEERPFGEAARMAEQLYGRPMRLPRSAMRSAYAAGRITDDDIDAVLVRRCGTAADLPALVVGDRVVTAFAAWRADLLTAPEPTAPQRHGTRSEQLAPRLARRVDELTAAWCAAYAGAPEAAFPMPGWTAGFYPAWRRLVTEDRSLPRRVRRRLQLLPRRAEDAALLALRALGVDRDGQRGCLEAHLTALPGWAAHARWSAGRTGELDLVDYLAVRLTYETALLAELLPRRAERLPDHPRTGDGASDPPEQRARRVAGHLGAVRATDQELTALAQLVARLPDEQRDEIWLEAFEGHYQDGLLRALDRPAAALHSPSAADRPVAQVICCIDARSEGLRRRLETLGAYETFGFAGFFAVPIRYTDLAGGAPADLCPVLIDPAYDVHEIPSTGSDAVAGRRLAGLATLAAAEHAFHAAKDGVASTFALAEVGGAVAAPFAAVKTLAPSLGAGLRRRGQQRVAPDAPMMLELGRRFTVDDQVLYAEVTLRTIGLHHRFARLVVLCAHGSTTENNPYQAALDCGACGGQRGAPTARTAAAILNSVDVRTGLRQRGIDIAPDTWFVAAEHDTAIDDVELLDRHLVPASHGAELERLARQLATVGRELAAERCALLPGAGARAVRDARAAAGHVRRRAADWAQVFPEWGLAGNAAFIVGPREMTAGLDLSRRTFLHSYDADHDPDGTALETILTAPLVVAQWINCQYYFSTVAPEVFGAGTKTVHNVVGSVGVVAGQAGDLRLGLPWQSVAVGDRLVHEPMRLLAVVQAPLTRLDDVIGRNPVLQRLFGNGWVPLVTREAPGRMWLRYTPAATVASQPDATATTPGWLPWTGRVPHAPSEQRPQPVPHSLSDEVEVSAR